jgi:hypothetical protein
MEREVHGSPDCDRLEVLRPEDGAVSSPSGGPSFIIDDAGEEDLFFSGGTDTGDPDLFISEFFPKGVLGFQGIFTPELRGVPDLDFAIVDPEIDRNIGCALNDEGIISGPFKIRAPVSSGARIAKDAGQG